MPTNKLTGSSAILFDIEAQKQAHALTADQVDFIMMHEIGHAALDHPRRLKLASTSQGDTTPIRHEFEFAADAFAFGLLRSRLLNELRYQLTADPKPTEGDGKEGSGLDALREYQASWGAACLLFTYMDFIDRAGQLLKTRLGERIRFRPHLDSHPKPKARMERLEQANPGDYFYTSPLFRYATSFFDRVLEYANGLDDNSLFESLTKTS